MNEQEELKIYKEVISECFGIITNMNDTFGYATAMCGEIDAMDFPKLMPLIKEYGFSDVSLAYESLKQKMEPIKPHCTEAFYKIKSLLADMELNLCS